MAEDTRQLVSIIMSVFNEENYVSKAIESILVQSYENFELIIIDDYSTDRSVEICRSFNDPRIRIFQKKNEPKYLSTSRNIGVRMARGEYVALQDADDTSAPKRIEIQLKKALELPGRRVVGCSYIRVENSVERLIQMPETHSDICAGFHRLFNRATIVSGTILASKHIFETFPYRIRFPYMQDWDQTLRIYESGDVEFYNCQEMLYKYFIRKKGVLFNPVWLDCNIFIRHCQAQRKKGAPECKSLEDFRKYLAKRPIGWMKWYGLMQLLRLNLWLVKVTQEGFK